MSNGDEVKKGNNQNVKIWNNISAADLNLISNLKQIFENVNNPIYATSESSNIGI